MLTRFSDIDRTFAVMDQLRRRMDRLFDEYEPARGNDALRANLAEEAERLSHKRIGTEHLLLGLLREEKCFAAEILRERGLRLSTIREADTIIVVDDGRVVGRGTHDELLETNETYREIVESQLSLEVA